MEPKQQSLAEKVFENEAKTTKEQETKSKQQALMETQQALTDWQAIMSELEEQQPLIAENKNVFKRFNVNYHNTKNMNS